MPTPIKDPKKIANWRSANKRVHSLECRIHNIAEGMVSCVRRIEYIKQNEADCKKPNLLDKYKRQEIGWRGRLVRYQMELNALIDESLDL